MARVEKYDENKWEIEEDLRALARAHAVNSDPERLQRAQKLAKEKLQEAKDRRAEQEYLIRLGGGEK